MKLITVLLNGNIESDLTYPIGIIEQVNEGQWEISVSSIAFQYTANSPPPVSHVTVSCNFVMGKFVNASLEPFVDQAVLNLLVYGNKPKGMRTIIGLKQREYFSVNNAQQVLRLSLKDSQSGQRLFGSVVTALILLRRIC